VQQLPSDIEILEPTYLLKIKHEFDLIFKYLAVDNNWTKIKSILDTPIVIESKSTNIDNISDTISGTNDSNNSPQKIVEANDQSKISNTSQTIESNSLDLKVNSDKNDTVLSILPKTEEDYNTELQLHVLEPFKKLNLLYNFSIIHGEYYSNSIDLILKDVIVNFKYVQKNLSPYIIVESNKYKSSILNKIFDIYEICKYIEKFHIYYSQLLSRIKSRLSKSNARITDIDFDKSLSNLLDNISLKKQNIEELIFLINVKLCIIDEGYLCEETTLLYLIRISSFIQQEIIGLTGKGISDIINNIITQKVNMLIYKSLFRFSNDSNKEYIISFSSKTYNYNLDSLRIQFENKENGVFIFKNFVNSAHHHYLNKNNIIDKSLIEQTEKKINKTFFNNVTDDSVEVLNVHKICKYYKRTLEDTNIITLEIRIKYLDSLIEKLDKLKTKSKSRDDLMNYFAFETTFILLINTKFRLLSFIKSNNVFDIKQLTKNWKEIHEFYFKYHNIFDVSSTYPFLFYKLYSNVITSFLISTNSIIEKCIDDDNVLNKISNFAASLVPEYHEAIRLFSKCVIQNRDAALMPVYMTMQECFCPFEYEVEENKGIEGKQTIDVFLDSSYILPSNYDYVSKLNQQDDLEFNKQYFIFSDLIHSAQEKKIENLLEGKSKKFEDKLKEGQSNVIQVIGLYAGLITFILGSFSVVYRFEFNKEELLVFIFVFTACISIFIILLKLVFNPEVVNVLDVFSPIFNSIKSVFVKVKDEDSLYFNKLKPEFKFHNFGLFIIFIIVVFSVSYSKITQYHNERLNVRQLDSVKIEHQKQLIYDSSANLILNKKNDSLLRVLKSLKYSDSIKHYLKK